MATQNRASDRSRSRERNGSGLRVGCKVRLRGLKSAADLNGQCGLLESFIESTGRWRVKLSDGPCKDLKPENLESLESSAKSAEPPHGKLQEGCRVKLHGLKNAVELNGQQGQLELFVNSTQRWRVKLDSGVNKDLKPDNLEFVPKEVQTQETQLDKQEKTDAPAHQMRKTDNPEPDTKVVETQKSHSIRADNLQPVPKVVQPPQSQAKPLWQQKPEPAAKSVQTQPSRKIYATDICSCGRPLADESVFCPECGAKRPEVSQGSRAADLRSSGVRPTDVLPKDEKYDDKALDLKPGDTCGPSGRFVILDLLGEGCFSTVWRVTDAFSPRGAEYALKVTRESASTRKALEREIMLMKHLSTRGGQWDPEGARYLLCLAFHEGFEHEGHLAVVFESLKYSLRTALDKYGQGKGLPLLPTVRDYSRCLFLGLRALRQSGLVHADVKPENLLLTKDSKSVKLSDFGCTLLEGETQHVTKEDFQPRFYRAPEIMLGQSFGTPIDMWSAGCTLFEIATDQFLFKADRNNSMLREQMQVSGAFPKNVVTSGRYASKHFDESGTFFFQRGDTSTDSASAQKLPLSGFRPPSRPVANLLVQLCEEPVNDTNETRHEFIVRHLADLVKSCLNPDQTSRIKPEDALHHRFLEKGAGDPLQDLIALWS